MKNSSRLLSIIDPIIRTWGSLSIGTRGQFKMGTRGSVCSGISIRHQLFKTNSIYEPVEDVVGLVGYHSSFNLVMIFFFGKENQ